MAVEGEEESLIDLGEEELVRLAEGSGIFNHKTAVYAAAKDLVADIPSYTYGDPKGKRSVWIGNLESGKQLPIQFIIPFPCPDMRLTPTPPVRVSRFILSMALLVVWAPDLFLTMRCH